MGVTISMTRSGHDGPTSCRRHRPGSTVRPMLRSLCPGGERTPRWRSTRSYGGPARSSIVWRRRRRGRWVPEPSWPTSGRNSSDVLTARSPARWWSSGYTWNGAAIPPARLGCL